MLDERTKYLQEVLTTNPQSEEEFLANFRKIAKGKGIGIPTKSEILAYINNNHPNNSSLGFNAGFLRKRPVRTMSGVAPVAVLTAPYPCPNDCAYCPTEPGVPKSYLKNEPAVMRALRLEYDPYRQVQDRLRALVKNGHDPEKIELIVIGGTWSALPRNYKFWFTKECFRGANDFAKNQKSKIKSQNYNSKLKTDRLAGELSREQDRNEKTKYRIIGITLETRPDHIDVDELSEMRTLGATRVELGVQALDDRILRKNHRGHGVAETVRATELLKRNGFKVTYHIMPGLPGSTPKRDREMFAQLFADERFQPDQVKLYPTVVTRGSRLYRWWKSGKYRPYSERTLTDLIIKMKAVVPPYVRIIRLIRDIPGDSIKAGNRITNLRQVLQSRGVACRCIRCREALGSESRIKNLELRTIEYPASGGTENFISYESVDGTILFGFCRLRLPGDDANAEELVSPVLRGSALIRELHVYGELAPLGRERNVQHRGLGRRLMREAERIARVRGYKRMAVIAGIGVRDYYRRLGYRQRETYMFKSL